MKNLTRGLRELLIIGMIAVLFTAFNATRKWALADGDDPKHRLVVVLEEGEPITLLGLQVGGTGTGGDVFSIRKPGKLLGSFSTDIIAGPPLLASIEDVLFTGRGSEGLVQLTLELKNGSIQDEHDALLFAAYDPFPPAGGTFPPGKFFDHALIVVATGVGEITGGTGAFANASGISNLYIKFELDLDDLTFSSAFIHTGSFVFDFLEE